MVIDILDAPVCCIETGHAVCFFKDRWHKMVQASGTAYEKHVISGLCVGITYLIFVGSIRLTIKLFQHQPGYPVDDEEQTCNDEDMDQ